MVRAAVLWSMGAQYVSFAVQFAVSVIISRYFLTPAEVGLFSIALAAAMIVSILQDFGLTRYLAGAGAIDRDHIRVCSSIALLFALLITLAILGLALPVAHFYSQPALAPILAIIAASFLFVPFSVVPMALLSRDLAFRGLFIVNVGSVVVQAGVALGLAAAGFSAFALAWAMVAQALARAILAQWVRPAMPPMPLRLEGFRPIVAFGSSSMLLYTIGAIGSRSADLIVGRLLSLTATGLFTRATSLASQLRTLVSGAISGVFYPAFARIIDRGEPLGPPYLRVVAGYTAVTWPAMAGLAVAAVPLVEKLFGPTWAETATVLQWIAIGEIIFVALPLHVEIPILRGRMATLIRFSIADMALSVGLLALGAHFGLQAAALSRIGYAALWLLLYVGLICRLAEVRVTALLRLYALSGLATLAAVLPMLAAQHWWPGYDHATFLMLCALALAGVALWLVALRLIRHPADAEIEGLVRELGTRITSTLRSLRA